MLSPTPARDARADSLPEESLANRYGRPQRGDSDRARRRGRWVAVALLVVAVVTTGWFALSGASGRIDYKDVGYSIVDDQNATVTFQLTVPPGTSVECDIKVMDQQAAPVGFRTVAVDGAAEAERTSPAEDTWHYTYPVRTVARGVTGVVETCRTR